MHSKLAKVQSRFEVPTCVAQQLLLASSSGDCAGTAVAATSTFLFFGAWCALLPAIVAARCSGEPMWRNDVTSDDMVYNKWCWRIKSRTSKTEMRKNELTRIFLDQGSVMMSGQRYHTYVHASGVLCTLFEPCTDITDF